jgi:hypothetical protein
MRSDVWQFPHRDADAGFSAAQTGHFMGFKVTIRFPDSMNRYRLKASKPELRTMVAIEVSYLQIAPN